MLALISISKNSWRDQYIKLLSYANDEKHCRINAFASVNSGHNEFDNEYYSDHSKIVKISAKLEKIIQKQDYNLYMRSIGDLFLTKRGLLSTNFSGKL